LFLLRFRYPTYDKIIYTLDKNTASNHVVLSASAPTLNTRSSLASPATATSNQGSSHSDNKFPSNQKSSTRNTRLKSHDGTQIVMAQTWSHGGFDKTASPSASRVSPSLGRSEELPAGITSIYSSGNASCVSKLVEFPDRVNTKSSKTLRVFSEVSKRPKLNELHPPPGPIRKLPTVPKSNFYGKPAAPFPLATSYRSSSSRSGLNSGTEKEVMSCSTGTSIKNQITSNGMLLVGKITRNSESRRLVKVFSQTLDPVEESSFSLGSRSRGGGRGGTTSAGKRKVRNNTLPPIQASTEAEQDCLLEQRHIENDSELSALALTWWKGNKDNRGTISDDSGVEYSPQTTDHMHNAFGIGNVQLIEEDEMNEEEAYPGGDNDRGTEYRNGGAEEVQDRHVNATMVFVDGNAMPLYSDSDLDSDSGENESGEFDEEEDVEKNLSEGGGESPGEIEELDQVSEITFSELGGSVDEAD